MSTRVIATAVGVLVLSAAGVLLWREDASHPVDPPSRPTPLTNDVARATAPVDPARSASSAAAATPVFAPASMPPQPDPFKAYLESSRARGGAEPAVPPPLSAPQDPFKAAFEANRRAVPRPVVSPFSGQN
jgi:hypothetical protein